MASATTQPTAQNEVQSPGKTRFEHLKAQIGRTNPDAVKNLEFIDTQLLDGTLPLQAVDQINNAFVGAAGAVLSHEDFVKLMAVAFQVAALHARDTLLSQALQFTVLRPS